MARAHAAPGDPDAADDDAIALAIQFADALSGERDGDGASERDGDGLDDGGAALDGRAPIASALDRDAAAESALTADERSGSAGGAEGYEAAVRARGARWWGQLDVGVAWRMRISAPLRSLSYRFDELWLVATWRR